MQQGTQRITLQRTHRVQRPGLSVLALIILFCYYEFDRWVPLQAWNGQFSWPVHNDQFYPDIIIGVLLIWMMWNYAYSKRFGMWVSELLLAIWLILHIQSFWVPYVQGSGSKFQMGRHNFESGRTEVLPIFDSHYPPDAEHFFIDVFVVIAFVNCAVRLAQIRKKDPSGLIT